METVQEAEFAGTLPLIHEAALEPAAWAPLLRHLAGLSGCAAGGLTVEDPATRRGTPITYFGFDTAHVRRAFDHFLPLNPLFDIAPRMQPGFVVANADVVPLSDFRRSEFFDGWARPQGLCSPVTVVLHRTPDAYVPLTLVRPDGAGEVTPAARALLTRLAPHLVRAMAITVRLHDAADTGRSLLRTLSALPRAALLLDGARRVLFANPPAETLFGPARLFAASPAHSPALARSAPRGPARPPRAPVPGSGPLAANHPAADAALQAALHAALRPPGGAPPPRAGQVVLPVPAGLGATTLSVTPLPPAETTWSALGTELAGRARCLLMLEGPDLPGFAARHGLTPAETRLLAALLDGKGLVQAARRLGVAHGTAHSQLDKIFGKTGTNRQAELVTLARA